MVGCLLSAAAEEPSKRSAVHAPATLCGPAHTKDATSAMSEHTDASEMRVFRPQYGHNLACYCEKRAATGYGRASPKLRPGRAYEHHDGRKGVPPEYSDRFGPPTEHPRAIPAFAAPAWQASRPTPPTR